MPQVLQCKLVGVVLQTCVSVDCVEYEVRVYMVGVGVSCHYNFVSRESSLRKLNSYLVSMLGSNVVAARVRLNEVIVFHTVSLSVHLSCIFEFLICSQQRTIESRHKLFILCLVIAADVVETFLSAATAFRAYRCDRRHYFTSRSS